MATINSLVEATIVGDNDLLLIDQGGEGKKLKKGNLKVDADNVPNANGGSVQDFIDAQYTTVAELATGKFQVGQYVRLTDRAMGLFLLQSGGTDNGTWALNAGNGNTAVLVEKEGNLLHYGATHMAPNSSVEFQAAIDHVNKWFIPKDITIFAKEIVVKDYTYGKNRGTLKLAAGQPEWARVFTNLDKVNGNIGVVIDNIGGILHGNRDAQVGDIVQHFGLFINCRDFDVFGGKMGWNKASEVTPSNSPDGPFNQGIPFGEATSVNPTVGFISYMGGSNNKTHNFTLIDWAQEGISTRWNTGSITTNFTAKNGPETLNEYYADVAFGSRAGTVTVSAGNNVLVQEGHEYLGVEQQPHLIYSALVAGTYDLSAEDYSNAARWSLVTRDISNDLGYSAARHAGSKGAMNIISNAKASFCRASSFSNDSTANGMSDLYSYHNAYSVGINFGHQDTPSDYCTATNLVAINSGWAGGVSGQSYGINLVGSTKGAMISNFYVCGAGRNGVNQSDGADDCKLSNGVVKFSAAGGIKSSNAKLTCVGVVSKNNIGDDFEAAGSSVISLTACEDSTGRLLNNERVVQTQRNAQPIRSLYGKRGSTRQSFRDSFAVSAGVPIVTLNASGSIVSDGLLVTLTYVERNAGSSSIDNQYAAKETFLVVGTGTTRGVKKLNTQFAQGRQFRAVWDVSGVLNIYLQNLTPADVGALNTQNSMVVEVQNSNWDYTIGIG